MKISNPILRGFYPDPSVCKVDDKYYMVCSSFQFFPGVPLFESTDLINWKQIGHCLTRVSQVKLDQVRSSGGIYAATIRYNDGRFYMVTTNNSTDQNFYIWTNNIYGEWSDPIFVDQDGIDPSLYFENNRAFFLSNGTDINGRSGIVRCEIDILTGEKISDSQLIWTGSGGRYLEAPHLYKMKDTYYLLAAEGGTEYGHMITCAKSSSIWGPFISNPNNPILTNRNLGEFEIQGIGHGDLVEGPDQNLYMLHLGFRQITPWEQYHHLGREVFITPIFLEKDGWFLAKNNATTKASYNLDYLTKAQEFKKIYTFENTNWSTDWSFIRIPNKENFEFYYNKLILHGTATTLSIPRSPTFVGLRQKEFNAKIQCSLDLDQGEAGLTIFMNEDHHYDLAIRHTKEGYQAIVRQCIGPLRPIVATHDLKDINQTKLLIRSDSERYHFFVSENPTETELSIAQTKYLSSEVAGGFTGVFIGLYAQNQKGKNKAIFKDFSCKYYKKTLYQANPL